eukprot:5176009-Amphidinium_carterae.2
MHERLAVAESGRATTCASSAMGKQGQEKRQQLWETHRMVQDRHAACSFRTNRQPINAEMGCKLKLDLSARVMKRIIWMQLGIEEHHNGKGCGECSISTLRLLLEPYHLAFRMVIASRPLTYLTALHKGLIFQRAAST